MTSRHQPSAQLLETLGYWSLGLDQELGAGPVKDFRGAQHGSTPRGR
jgi:hypothetical protein